MKNTPTPLYIGIKGNVVALDLSTGTELWRNPLKGGSQFVNVTVEQSHVLATTSGELFCLDKLSGRTLWHNKLKGLGQGLVTIATDAPSSQVVNAMQVIMNQQRAAGAAAAGAVAAA